MKRSTDRILTSHAGSLPRPHELLELYRSKPTDSALADTLSAAVADVVQQQVDAGIDIVNDGEFGKPMSEETDFAAWVTYLYPRMSGYEMREIDLTGFTIGKDQKEFADFYAKEDELFGGKMEIGVAVDAIKYIGQDVIKRDVDNLNAAIKGKGVSDAVIMAITPEFGLENGEYYATKDEETAAIAEALREEYKAIVDGGLNVQIDDPILVNYYEWMYSEGGDMNEFRKWAEGHIERINYALEGIPEENVRYHVCWGSWKGPHSSDLPLEHVIDIVLKANAQTVSVEAANPRHEHEWKVWKDANVPDGKVVMPGVVTHKTNVIEHPDLVADRIIKYAEAVGRENVIAGTDCGMGGRIHPQLAWAKLKVLSEGAQIASKKLWG